jgi:hypothetical protein
LKSPRKARKSLRRVRIATLPSQENNFSSDLFSPFGNVLLLPSIL